MLCNTFCLNDHGLQNDATYKSRLHLIQPTRKYETLITPPLRAPMRHTSFSGKMSLLKKLTTRLIRLMRPQTNSRVISFSANQNCLIYFSVRNRSRPLPNRRSNRGNPRQEDESEAGHGDVCMSLAIGCTCRCPCFELLPHAYSVRPLSNTSSLEDLQLSCPR